jgi:phosphoesterase RecJ-like protein
MMTRIPPKLLSLIKKNKNFLIVSHINPEGDAIGSCVALALGLKKMGKYVYVLNRDPVPQILKFLPYSDMVSRKVPRLLFDIMFVVDCVNVKRTGLKNLKAKTTIIIDHHIPQPENEISMSNNQRAHNLEASPSISLIEPDASATGELVYRLLRSLGVSIDNEIAENLYTAIYTDTGGFRYSNINPGTLRIVSELIKAGVDPWKVTREVYESFSLNRLRLLGMSLCTIEKKGKIACITVTQQMFKNTDTSAEDTEDFVDFPRKVKDIEVAVLLREDGKDSYKISLRSKGNINVESIAKDFGGGGHPNAAGCKIKGSISEVKEKIFKAIRKVIRMQVSPSTI